MLLIGSQHIGTVPEQSGAYTPAPGYEFRWEVEIFHRSGGLKKHWAIGQHDCPIVSLKFENNLAGCGAGDMVLAFVDFPIDADDYIRVYRYGLREFYGIVNTQPDPKGGNVEIIPIHQRFEELLITPIAYSSKTVEYILKDVITTYQTDTGILWSDSMVDTGSTDLITISYDYETPKKIIEDLVERLTDRYWGVDANGFFYVRQYPAAVNDTLLYHDAPAYTEIEAKYEYSGVKDTRFQVMQKVTGNSQVTRAGEVGYGGSYPTLAIEKLMRKKVGKITAPEVLSGTDALKWAYAKLCAQEIYVNVTLKNCNLDVYYPRVGRRVKVQDREEKQLVTVLSCDSVTNWTGATLDTADFVEGTGSVYFTAASIGNGMTYLFDRPYRYFHNEKLGFMIKSSVAGQFLKLKIYDTTFTGTSEYSSGAYGSDAYSMETIDPSTYHYTEVIINIPHGASWYYIEFPYTYGLYYMRFEVYATPTASAKVSIDRVQLWQYYRRIYEEDIVQVNFDITPDKDNVTAKLRNYDILANDALFEYESKIRNLESITNKDY